MKITKQMLIDAKACEDQVKLFEATFPDGATWPDDMEKASRAELDVRWAIYEFKLSGRCRVWYDNGQLWVDATYERGERHGRCRVWYDNGKLWVDEIWERDELHGRYREWYANGQLSVDATYERDARHGRCRRWHANGELWVDEMWKNGGVVR